jgi:hypothetical protein
VVGDGSDKPAEAADGVRKPAVKVVRRAVAPAAPTKGE